MWLLHGPRREGWRLAARCSPVPIKDEKMFNATQVSKLFFAQNVTQSKIPEDTCPPVALRAEKKVALVLFYIFFFFLVTSLLGVSSV